MAPTRTWWPCFHGPPPWLHFSSLVQHISIAQSQAMSIPRILQPSTPIPTLLFHLAWVSLLAVTLANCVDGQTPEQERVGDLVSADPFPRLELHVDYVEGRKYRPGVANDLADGLVEVVDKPEGVAVVEGEPLPPAAPEEGWTLDELRQFVETRAAEIDAPSQAVTTYTLFVDGEFAQGTSEGTVLGLAWANRYSVVFQDQIEDACQSQLGLLPGADDPLCSRAELTIWRHEIGHLLGLVNVGAPLTTDHADPDDPSHCRHEHCVMYRAYRGPALFDALAERLGDDRSVPDFGDDCRADLNAAASQ